MDNQENKIGAYERYIGPIKHFICGGVGGICTVLVGHPLDTMKVRLQTMSQYKGMLDCAQQTFKAESFRGFYKGMGPPLIGIAPIFAMSFMGYNFGSRLFGPGLGKKLTYFQQFEAGLFAGAFSTVVMTPVERVKCLLQVQTFSKGGVLYKGPIDCVIKLFKEGGIPNIYKGTLATLGRDIPASGAYFVTFEVVKDYLEKDTLTNTFIAGGFSGITYWLAGMPVDVCKSRFQTAPHGTYKNVREVAAKLFLSEGPLGFYKGLTPVIIRSFPANAVCWVGFTFCFDTFKYFNI